MEVYREMWRIKTLHQYWRLKNECVSYTAVVSLKLIWIEWKTRTDRYDNWEVDKQKNIQQKFNIMI